MLERPCAVGASTDVSARLTRTRHGAPHPPSPAARRRGGRSVPGFKHVPIRERVYEMQLLDWVRLLMSVVGLSAANDPKEEKEVRATMQAMADATIKKDINALRRIFHEDFYDNSLGVKRPNEGRIPEGSVRARSHRVVHLHEQYRPHLRQRRARQGDSRFPRWRDPPMKMHDNHLNILDRRGRKAGRWRCVRPRESAARVEGRLGRLDMKKLLTCCRRSRARLRHLLRAQGPSGETVERLDPALDAIIAPDAKAEVMAPNEQLASPKVPSG